MESIEVFNSKKICQQIKIHTAKFMRKSFFLYYVHPQLRSLDLYKSHKSTYYFSAISSDVLENRLVNSTVFIKSARK